MMGGILPGDEALELLEPILDEDHGTMRSLGYPIISIYVRCAPKL
jgi:hypothetical protein